MRELHDDLEVDIAAYNKHKTNMAHKSNINGFNQLFKGGTAEVRSVTSHNVHKNIGRIQQGGTCVLMFGPITDHIIGNEPTKDESGLGRWSVMTLAGGDIKTRIICRYNPCYNSVPDTSSSHQKHRYYGTSYQLHRRYFRPKNKFKCPCTLFKEHLIKQLKKWREAGDRLVICLDTNEDIYKKSIGKELTDPGGLALQEVVGDYTQQKIGSTFFRGSKPIDGIWATPDITISNATIMPSGFGVGDHRLFIIDMATSNIIGTPPSQFIRPVSC
jgi:hypothetical protein